MDAPLLSLILFTPLLGALLLVFLPRRMTGLLYGAALAASLAAFAASLVLLVRFQGSSAEAQFVERLPWLGGGIQFHIGVDGLSLFLVLLTTLLMPLALLSSRTAVADRIKEYLFFMLVLETGLIGVFVSLNLFLFYVFWEAALIPMYFLIGIWGGPRRVYATTKFVLVTMFGSLLMLVAVFALSWLRVEQAGTASLAFADLAALSIPAGLQTWLFLAFALAFAIKVPMFPLHTWLPDAHVEAPTAGSVILAAVLLKMGIYGFLRLAWPLFPEAAARFRPALAVLAVVGIIYGGLMALVQKDVKSLVAYSSVSHMGLIMLAVCAGGVEAVSGAVYQMLNHGLSTGALFLLVGMLYERAHTRRLDDFGGVARVMPVFAAVLLVASLSSLGLPGLNGFVGEFLCFVGIFAAHKTWGVLALATLVLSAAYLLGMLRRVLHGPIVHEKIRTFRDLTPREILVLAPLLVLMFVMGVAPGLVLGRMDASVRRYVRDIRGAPTVYVRLETPPAPAVAAPRPEARLERPAADLRSEHAPLPSPGAARRTPPVRGSRTAGAGR